MATTKTMQLHDVTAQSESTDNALEIAGQRARTAQAACDSVDAATTETNSMPTPRDDRSLNAFGEQWRSLQMESLELRWQIGVSCNENLGRSMSTKEVANRIGCGLPDLHLMMWFAKLVPNLNDFLKNHPGLSTWGKVKEFIAQSNPNRKTRKRSEVGKLIGLMRRLTSQYQEGNVAFEKKDVNKLTSVLVKFTMALNANSRSTDASEEESE